LGRLKRFPWSFAAKKYKPPGGSPGIPVSGRLARRELGRAVVGGRGSFRDSRLRFRRRRRLRFRGRRGCGWFWSWRGSGNWLRCRSHGRSWPPPAMPLRLRLRMFLDRLANLALGGGHRCRRHARQAHISWQRFRRRRLQQRWNKL